MRVGAVRRRPPEGCRGRGAPPAAEDLARQARSQGVEVWSLDARVLERLSPTRTSQGLLGGARAPSWTLEDTLGRDLVVVLEGIQDPGNVGTLLRTARAAGAGGAILVGGADPYSPRSVRSAAGALFHLPWSAQPDWALRCWPPWSPVVTRSLRRSPWDRTLPQPCRSGWLWPRALRSRSSRPPRRAQACLSIPRPFWVSRQRRAAAAVLLSEFRRRSRLEG